MKPVTKNAILIVCAALVGGATEAAGLFPGIKEILMGLNIFIGAVMIYISNKATA